MVMSPIDPAIAAIIEELRQRIAQLERVVAEKDRRIAELERTVEEQARKIDEQARIIEEWKRGHRARPRSGSKKKAREKKKPGRKPGHEPAQRPMPDRIDREEQRKKDECDGCRGGLTPTGKTREVVVEHVIPARVEVEKNILFEYLCDCCGKIQWSELPPEYGPEPPPGQPLLGPGVLCMALGLRYEMRLSFGKIAEYFENHVGLKVTDSGVYQLIERAARRTKAVSEEILEQALMSAWLNMDETSWWEDGKKLWAWLMANLDLSYFHFDESRGHKVIEKLLCELSEDGEVTAPYEGTVVSDFMGAYRTCEWMVHQWCWVHLLRDADKALEIAPDERIRKFSDGLHSIYTNALIAQSTADKSKQHGIRVRLGRLVADTELGKHPDVARLQYRALEEFHGLLHFMSDPQIPAHNNGGELAARALVVMRKVIGGTRSKRGTQAHAHFMSTSQTAHKQGIDHGDFIIKALAAYHSGAPPPSIFES
jgi:transposase